MLSWRWECGFTCVAVCTRMCLSCNKKNQVNVLCNHVRFIETNCASFCKKRQRFTTYDANDAARRWWREGKVDVAAAARGDGTTMAMTRGGGRGWGTRGRRGDGQWRLGFGGDWG